MVRGWATDASNSLLSGVSFKPSILLAERVSRCCESQWWVAARADPVLPKC